MLVARALPLPKKISLARPTRIYEIASKILVLVKSKLNQTYFSGVIRSVSWFVAGPGRDAGPGHNELHVQRLTSFALD